MRQVARPGRQLAAPQCVVEELARFRASAPGMPYAHPTVEHFTPLFVTLGAATDPTAPVTTTIDGYAIGLAKRSFQAA